MTDKTIPLPNANDPIVDRLRRLTPVWYRWLAPLLKTTRETASGLGTLTTTVQNVQTDVAGNTTQITTVSETLDAVKAQWGVEINVNGRITGAVKLDGSDAESVFGILADKFVVVHPSLDGTTITAFIVGNVNGTPTVGINGNLIVDDTILARHLDVASLSSITANIGTVTTGRLQNAANTSWLDLNTNELVFTA